MKRSVFILLPAMIPTGPVKGAIALANALSEQRAVTIVALKDGKGGEAPLDARVKQVCLASEGSFRGKIARYRQMLAEAGGRGQVASISMCLSADVANLFARRCAVTCASVRSNLISNYRMDYGWPGVPLALLHLLSLRGMDRVVSMTRAMARHVFNFSAVSSAVIGNFVDEGAIEQFRSRQPHSGALRFVFLGSLSERKQPLLAIRALATLVRAGHDAVLEIIGDGPLLEPVRREIAVLGLQDRVRLHGFLRQPYESLAACDVLLLPSKSEGVSRACLEALYLGVPCVLRDVDGNGELIDAERNGSLFARDEDLPAAMLRAAELSRRNVSRDNLLPEGFRQQTGAMSYMALVESL